MTRVYLEMPGIVLGEVEDDDVDAMHRSGSRAKSEANCRLIAQTPFEARSVLASRHGDANPRIKTVINGPRWEGRFSLRISCGESLTTWHNDVF